MVLAEPSLCLLLNSTLKPVLYWPVCSVFPRVLGVIVGTG